MSLAVVVVLVVITRQVQLVQLVTQRIVVRVAVVVHQARAVPEQVVLQVTLVVLLAAVAAAAELEHRAAPVGLVVQVESAKFGC